MMDQFFTFFAAQRLGIFVFLLFLAGIALIVQWFAWIFGHGRFQAGGQVVQSNMRYIFVEFLTKIIDQFRHLLALLVVLIFAIALAYAMVESQKGIPADQSGAEQLQDVLTIIMSTLGSLVGLILGYYFGESSVSAAVDDSGSDDGGMGAEPAVQGVPEADAGEIVEAPPPPATATPPAPGSPESPADDRDAT